MYKKIESLGNSLLSLFVPKVEAAASASPDTCWVACYQCQGTCGYHAACCYYSSRGYVCAC